MKEKCNLCGRKFNSKEALDQHASVKHSGQLKEKKKSNAMKYLPFLAFGLVVVIIGVLFLQPNEKPSYEILSADSEHVKGPSNASIEITEYSDFQCPFCKQATGTMEQLFEEYDGKIKLTYKHFPLTNIHEFAFKAAEASECAADQGKFWEYHDVLFEKQPALNINNLKNYASDIGLNRTLFDACLDSGVMYSRVIKDFEEGKTKIRSTPTFFVNGQRIEGAQPIEVFRQAIRV